MRNSDIARQIRSLRDLVRRADQACGGDIEMQSHWARYLCVLSAGLIENSVKASYTDYARRTVSAPVARYVGAALARVRNPRTETILDLAGGFKNEWRDELEVFVRAGGRAEAVDNIMGNRHQIAHGQGRNSNLSLSQVEDYLSKAIEVLEFVEKQCYR